MTDNISPQDNDLECARCGATFYYELTRCPNCGVNLYEPDDDLDDWQEKTAEGELSSSFLKRLRFPAAILLGWLLSGILSLVFYIPLRTALARSTDSAIQLLILVSVALGTFAGGYLAFRIAQRRANLSGLLIGVLGIGFAVLLTAHEWGQASLLPLSFGAVLGWAFIALSGLGGGAVAQKMLQKNTLDLLFPAPPSEDELYQDLLTKVRFDRQVAERLIGYERERAPQATQGYLIQSAIQRWQRDNR